MKIKYMYLLLVIFQEV